MILKELLENMTCKSLIEIKLNNVEFKYTAVECLSNLGEYWLNKDIAYLDVRYDDYFKDGYLYVELK